MAWTAVFPLWLQIIWSSFYLFVHSKLVSCMLLLLKCGLCITFSVFPILWGFLLYNCFQRVFTALFMTSWVFFFIFRVVLPTNALQFKFLNFAGFFLEHKNKQIFMFFRHGTILLQFLLSFLKSRFSVSMLIPAQLNDNTLLLE